MRKKLAITGLLIACGWACQGALLLGDALTTYTINFDSTVADVNNDKFTGTGFQANPTAGQLDSDSWASAGWSSGTLPFGGTQASDDFRTGTIAAPSGIDWLCVSPKAGSETVQRSGNELKLVWPQPGSDAAAISGWAFDHFLIQPMDGPELAANRAASIAFILANPMWRLSTQTHKVLGIA